MIFSLENKKKDAVALLADTGLAVTYGELCSMSKEMGQVLEEGKLAVCLCENTPGAVAGYLAFMNNKVVPLMLDAKLGEPQLKNMLDTYKPDYIWAPSEETDPTINIEEQRKLIDGSVLFSKYGYDLWKVEKQKEDETVLNPQLALLLATSGSTGSPKLVRLSRENVESNAESICEYLDIDETERPITTLPLQYTYGLSIVNSHLLAGATVLMTKSSYVQSEFWEFLNKEEATSFGGVPYTYQILKRLRVFRKDMPTIKYLTQAGGKLSVELQEEIGRWAEKYGKKFFVMYGQTEATARMSYLPAERCLEKIGSMGIAIPGGKFSIIDDSGNEMEQPEISGELIYHGPNVSLGYAQTREDLKKGDERNGRLATGDLAKRDADGFYYIVGRKKRFVKMFGIRVSLDQCENLLKEIYKGKEIVICGTDDNILICTTDEEAAKEAPDQLSELLKISQKGFTGRYVKEIPRNSSGKIQYNLLLEQL